MSPYSLVEHLAKAVWFSRWREGHLAVFSAYFDASGSEADVQAKYVAMSGFIAQADLWTEWEMQWLECLERNKIFNKHGVPEFHMSECANYRYSFDGWREKERERQSLLHELVEIIKTYLGRKASCVVSVDDYRKYIDEDLRKAFGMSGVYVMEGRTCAARVKEWCRKDRVPALPDVQFFFEHGDGDQLQADLLNRLMDDEYPRPIFKSKKDRYSRAGELVDHGLVPFQASDVLAYLTNIEAKFAERPHWGDKQNIRWMLNDLSPIPEPTFTFTPSHLTGFNDLMRVCLDNTL
jgi:hypothetical protein